MKVATVNLRSSSDLDPIAEAAYFNSRRLPGRAVFLIHGYNTSTDRATEGYQSFEEALARASVHLQGASVRVLWPDDQPGRLLPSVLYFAQAARNAERAATVLMEFILEWLDEFGPTGDVVLVAHSLGCLLATQVATKLTARISGRLVLILMAAAIPVTGEYGALLDERCWVLYSPDDKILRRFFPFGQRQADDVWTQRPEAVGLHGLPSHVWQQRRHMRGYDHSDYWASNDAAGIVCEALGLSHQKTLPDAQVSEAALPERELPERNGIEESVRSIPIR